MERNNNNSPNRYDIRKHLSIDGLPVEAYDAITSGISRKVGLSILVQLLAAGAISKEAYAKWAEKLVVADSNGNITPVVNEDGNVTVGTSIKISNSPERGVFDEESYIVTDYSGPQGLSIRDNKTLQETNFIPAQYVDYPIVNLEIGAKAFIEWNTGVQIHIQFKDGTNQIIPLPNSQNTGYVYALQFSNNALYVASKDNKTDSKYYLRVFRQGANGQYEDSGEKINLPAQPYGMVLYNGKILVNTRNQLVIYNQDTLEQEASIPFETGIGVSVARPNTNTVWGTRGGDGVGYIDLNTKQAQIIFSYSDMDALLGEEYGIGRMAFSPDGNRLYITTYSGVDKNQHYLITLYLNTDGTIQSMQKSIITQGYPAPSPNDLSMDVDSDQDNITNSLDNCPYVSNPAQTDTNANSIGDACENPDEYAASKGYENHQEADGHVIYSKGGTVDVIDMGDKVVVSPVQGQTTDFEIISNGEPQTKPLAINVPQKTSYSFNFLEGQGDIEETVGVDCPEGKTCSDTTEEHGVLIGVSGTHIIGHTEPASTSVEEAITADEGNTQDVFIPSDEFTSTSDSTPEEVQTPDNAKPDVAELPDTSEEVGKDTAQPDAPQPDTIQYDTTKETAPDFNQHDAIQPDVIQQDNISGNDTHETISTDTYQPPNKGGGGGCKMNPNSMNGAESIAMTLTMLMVLGMKKVKYPVSKAINAARERIAEVLRG